jgi:hypothetical protein
MVNILCFADDMVRLAPSWRGLQFLIDLLFNNARVTFNTRKTVCMIFNPYRSRKIVCTIFPNLRVGTSQLEFVTRFKYLGHIIDNILNGDADIVREIGSLFTRCNILIRRFSRCSLAVKLRLFRSYCICFYDSALWVHYSSQSLAKLLSCCNKYIKNFFGFAKYSSVLHMLRYLGLPSFNTVLINQRASLNLRISSTASWNISHLSFSCSPVTGVARTVLSLVSCDTITMHYKSYLINIDQELVTILSEIW